MNGSKPLMARWTSVGVLPTGRLARRLPSPLPSPSGRGRLAIQRVANPLRPGSFQRGNRPPSPEGEGRGEGKRDSGPASARSRR